MVNLSEKHKPKTLAPILFIIAGWAVTAFGLYDAGMHKINGDSVADSDWWLIPLGMLTVFIANEERRNALGLTDGS